MDPSYIEGVPVYVDLRIDSPALVLQDVTRALQLIKKTDARLFRRIQRDLVRIFVRPYKGTAFYSIRSGTCVLGNKLASERLPLKIAVTIIHEAIHARIDRSGIPWITDPLKNRIERICIQEELDFVRKLPDTDYPGKSHLIEAFGTLLAKDVYYFNGVPVSTLGQSDHA